MERTKSGKSNNVREFDVYFRSKISNNLIWCNSFISLFKDNKRAAKYWVKKMKEKEPSYEYVIVERE